MSCGSSVPARARIESGAKATALQTLRDCRASSNFAKRLDCGAFTAITHRKDAVCPATIVGIPPMEDFYIGGAALTRPAATLSHRMGEGLGEG